MSMMAHMVLEDFVLKNVQEDLADLIDHLSLVRKFRFQSLKSMNIYVQNVVNILCIMELEKYFAEHVKPKLNANVVVLKKENV